MSGCAGFELLLHRFPELGVVGMMGAFDDGDCRFGLLRPAAALRRGSGRGDGAGDLAGKRGGDAGRGGAQHELAAVDEAVTEIDDGLVAQALALGEAQSAFTHGEETPS